MTDMLAASYPGIARHLPKVQLADLPTPVTRGVIQTTAGERALSIKHDDATSLLYGGNKTRKLEYILRRAVDRGASRVATFGAVGSHHALATAMHAHELGLACTCFLAHQKRAPSIGKTLNMHRQLGTEIVRYGGSIDKLPLFRRYLQGRKTWVVPLGGSCWLGVAGFVNAALELVGQVESGDVPCPQRIYVANGTMGTVAGLAIGLVAAGLRTEIHAVRVADNDYTNPLVLDRLMQKTAILLNRLDPAFPADAASRARIRWRDEFFAGGYAVADDATTGAVAIARDALGLQLETTYTGKAMAALLHDVGGAGYAGESCLFWNTHNSRPLPVPGARPAKLDNIPEEFARYYDDV
jgi:D-cysteine desulfhydrase